MLYKCCHPPKERGLGWTCTQEAPGISQTLWAGLGWAGLTWPGAQELAESPRAVSTFCWAAAYRWGGGAGGGAALRGVCLEFSPSLLQPTYASHSFSPFPIQAVPLACWRSPGLRLCSLHISFPGSGWGRQGKGCVSLVSPQQATSQQAIGRGGELSSLAPGP